MTTGTRRPVLGSCAGAPSQGGRGNGSRSPRERGKHSVNKTQLINQVARKAKITKTAAKQCVDACFTAIKKSS